MPKLAIIIVHYKNEQDTRQCLDSLLNSKTDIKFYPIVVANDCQESFAKKFNEKYPQVKVFTSRDNLGVAGGNNLGIKKALAEKCDYFLILNNDTIASPQLVSKLILMIRNDPKVGIISPKIYFAPQYEFHHNRYKRTDRGKVIWYAGGIIDWKNIYALHIGVDRVDKGQFEKIQNTDFATGCCMLISLAVIKKIGIFDEKYFLYFEDVDYSIRAKSNGFKVIYYPDAFLWHKNAASSNKPGSDIHNYYLTRNRLYFGLKYGSFRAKKSLIIDSLRHLRKGRIYKKAVLDFYLGKMGKGNI